MPRLELWKMEQLSDCVFVFIILRRTVTIGEMGTSRFQKLVTYIKILTRDVITKKLFKSHRKFFIERC